MPLVNSPHELSLEQLRRLAAGDEPADRYVLSLLQNMESADEELRAWTSDALHSVAVLPSDLAAAVAEKCRHSQAAVAAAACGLLAKLGPSAAEYQASIVFCLSQHPKISARQQAALALASIQDLSPATVAALHTASESSDPRLQRLAQAALGQNR